MSRKFWLLFTVFTILAMGMAACGPGVQGTATSSVPTAATGGTQAFPGTGGTGTPAALSTPTLAVTPEMTATMPVTGTAAVAGTPTLAATEAITGTATVSGTAAPGAGGTLPHIGGTVTVLGVWGGDELDSFNAMIKPFEDQTGIQVQFEGTRDLNAVLTTRVQGGNPPDLAGLPGPGQLRELAQSGKLIPLNDVLDTNVMNTQYDPGFLQLATVNDKLYGIFTKGSVKSLVWYSPKAFDAAGYKVPTTWEELQALEQQIISSGATPWCIGLESGAASGWPGTDWVEDILLHTSGPDTYDQWWQHQIPWTDPAVKTAWDTWGKIVNDPKMTFGGMQTVLSTNFGQAFFPLFDPKPGCYMYHLADFTTGFIKGQYPNAVAGQDYNFFVFPSPDPQYKDTLEVGGDLFGMFKDTPQARALIKYLATADAQTIWAKRGGFLSANRSVDPSAYPDQLTQQIAQMLKQAKSVRFDASDQMPEAVNNAFWKGILDYVSNPGNLDSILQTIESAAKDAYK